MNKHLLLATTLVLALPPLLLAGRQEAPNIRSVDGIAFSEFNGYQAWALIAPSVPTNGVKAILGNPRIMEAIGQGVMPPATKVPNGAMMAKITWASADSAHLPGAAMVPNELRRVQFMVKDSERFPETSGWGYAQFDFDAATKTFKAANGPNASAKSCHQCHTRVQSRDFVFTDYAVR